jgi:hypothetical protein
VAIDADTGDIAHRTRQLEQSLAVDGLTPRAGGERIIHLIPRRNIETWILNLNGNEVDEETDYRPQSLDDLIVHAARTLFEWTRPNSALPVHSTPSLRAAIQELRRLEEGR